MPVPYKMSYWPIPTLKEKRVSTTTVPLGHHFGKLYLFPQKGHYFGAPAPKHIVVPPNKRALFYKDQLVPQGHCFSASYFFERTCSAQGQDWGITKIYILCHPSFYVKRCRV